MDPGDGQKAVVRSPAGNGKCSLQDLYHCLLAVSDRLPVTNGKCVR